MSQNLTAVDLSKKGGKNDDFKLTPEEARNLEQKMKDPEFMKLWVEYAQSLADPKVREEEEAYLRQVEEEAKNAGDDSFDFIFPKAAFAVELTECPDKLPGHRVAVNICTCDKVEQFREETTGDRMGSHWHVPVAVGPQRVEKKSAFDADWEVYDAVFHPLTVDLANRSDRFMVFLCEIAVEHINGGYKRRFDFKFSRLPSTIPSVGTPKNQTVRRSTTRIGKQEGPREVSVGPLRAQFQDDQQQKKQQQQQQSASATTAAKKNGSGAAAAATSASSSSSTSQKQQQIPKKIEGNIEMTIAHRGEIDLTDAWNWAKLEKRIGVPKELVLRAQLPGVVSAREIDVEVPGGVKVEITVAERKLSGSILLDFTVSEEPVSAKFEKTKKELTLVFRVVPPPAPPSAIAPEEDKVKNSGYDDDDKDKKDSSAKKTDQEQQEQKEQKQQQAQAAEEKNAEELRKRQERAHQAVESMEKQKQEAAALKKAQEEKDKQQEAEVRKRQEAWLKEEEERKQKQQLKQQQQQEAEAAAAAAAEADRRKKQQQLEEEAEAKRKAAVEKAAAATTPTTSGAAASAAAASSSDLLLLDDDDEEDYRLPGEQKAKLEDQAALREAAKKQADAQRQEELMQAELDKKMRQLPLTNEFIFGID